MRIFSLFLLLFSFNLQAAPIPLNHSNGLVPAGAFSSPKLGEFFKQGTVTGGQAVASGGGFSILRIQKLVNAEGIERVVLTFGDADGLPLRVQPGFFHLTVDQNSTRVVLDLAQTQKTTVDRADLNRVFKDSGHVKSADIAMDPVDISTNITLQMKKAVRVKAFVENDERKVNQLVIDFE